MVLISSEVGGLYVNATPVIRGGDVGSGDLRCVVSYDLFAVSLRGEARDGDRDDA